MCNNWPEFPIDVYGATGGIIGNTVTICGGGWYVDECYSLTSEKATLVTHMSVGRWFAVWHFRLWSFQGRDTKLERFLVKNQLYSNEITKF